MKQEFILLLPSTLTMETILRTPHLLLLILGHVDDLQTLVSLRQISRIIYKIISVYEASICTDFARRLFDLDKLGIYQAPETIRELSLFPRVVIATKLSILTVEANQMNLMPGIPADDPFGDSLRERVKTGWLLAWRLADIAQQVERIYPYSEYEEAPPLLPLRKRLLHSSKTFPIETRHHLPCDRETTTLSRWVEFVRNMKPEDAVNLEVMMWCRDSRIMLQSWWPSWCTPPGNVSFSPGRNVTTLEWFKGLLLRKGPRFVLRLWDSDPKVREEAENAVPHEARKRSANRLLIESETYSQFRKQVREIHSGSEAAQRIWQDTFMGYLRRLRER